MVKFQQPIQHFYTGRFADSEADALACFVEVMSQIQVVPTVSDGYSLRSEEHTSELQSH